MKLFREQNKVIFDEEIHRDAEECWIDKKFNLDDQ